MNPHELILLSPYRVPGQSSLMIGNEDVGAFLNGSAALWHPAVALGAAAPPHVGSPYDYEQPAANHVYAVPDSPPLFLPDDWDQRVRDAGAVAFRCTLDRETTLANLREALRSRGDGAPPAHLIDLPAERMAPFFGIGFGYLHLTALFEAMEHENLLATGDLWSEVQQAIAALGNTDDPEAWRRHLQAAADRLQAGREVLYPVTIHILDVALTDEARLGESLPAAFEQGLPLNLIAGGRLLERMAREQPERFAHLKERVSADQAEVVGSCYVEREDALLPVESQIWNLLKGQKVTQDLLGREVRVFARKRFGFHPQLPQLLNTTGINRALLLAFDDGVIPSHRTTVISWPSPDGKQVEAFARAPYAAENPQTFFHVAHYLHKTIMQDQAATIALLHGAAPAAAWYRDWLELTRFGPVLGKWTTFSVYLGEVYAGEYTSAVNADEFHGDYLSELTNAKSAAPVSAFARHVRLRRRIDTAWTLAAIQRGLAGKNDSLQIEARLSEVEDRIEAEGADTDLESVEKEVAESLAARLLSRATADGPGYLVLNPCSFTRRVALELDDVTGPLPIGGPIKAGQFEGTHAKLVVEVPALGFAWVPRSGPPGTPQPTARMKLADDKAVRNEFFEAEIDPQTGGLRGIRDHRARVNRLGQLLTWNPGSTTRCHGVKVTSAGPALGEVVTEGAILDEQDREMATFRQRFRAWLGRPILDLRIEITPQHLPEGYPWHAYYGARFAWSDERAVVLRGVNGTGYVTSHTRPESPDFLELRLGKQSTTIFPGGLPFHQRHGGRMADVILMPEGETARTFDLAIGLDREYPTQTALGLVTPVPLVPAPKGPPHVGATGWLFHLDMPNIALLGMRPATEGADAVVARLQEISARGAHAEFRCARDPRRAVVLNARGEIQMEANVSGDAVLFEMGQGDLTYLRVEFS
jgi:Glycosyl hydrolases family 38 N-terminal domain